MIRSLLVFLSLSLSIEASAGDKIKYYFNHPVDNSVSTGVNAIYLNNTIDDTLISYIKRAKYTIDVAVYHFRYHSRLLPMQLMRLMAAVLLFAGYMMATPLLTITAHCRC